MADADPTSRLNAALEGRYCIERQLGAGGWPLCIWSRMCGTDDAATRVQVQDSRERIRRLENGG